MGDPSAIRQAPCREACPAGVDVPRYVACIREGDFDRALAVIRERLPFPAVCAYACLHPCEAQCARRTYDDAVAIRALKRAAVAEADKASRQDPTITAGPTGKRVAVIGSGPCGLTAAWHLAGKGHEVTVFEARLQPGGMMRYAIPAYRLPKEVVDEEIDLVRERGVAIITGTRVESAAKLREQGFDAVLAATGAWRALRTGAATELPGVLDGLSFLLAVNTGNPPPVGNKVVVVGGGNTAMDAARSAVRLGAAEVLVLYRRTRAQMPAAPEEVAQALAEGVGIEFLTTPVQIQPGRAVCTRVTPGDAGGPVPAAIEGSESTVFFDTLVMAVGQAADASAVGLPGHGNGTVQADRQSLATARRAVFAAGDAVTGPSSIIRAIAQGAQAASSLDRYLGGDGVIDRERAGPAGIPREPAPRGSARQIPPSLAAPDRKSSFVPVEASLGPAAAVREAGRCLACDRREWEVAVQPSLCKGCGYCMEVCQLDVFAGSGTFNAAGHKPVRAVHSDKCVGCLRCLMICPDFAITVRKASSI